MLLLLEPPVVYAIEHVKDKNIEMLLTITNEM